MTIITQLLGARIMNALKRIKTDQFPPKKLEENCGIEIWQQC
jgi:hypothetical protein